MTQSLRKICDEAKMALDEVHDSVFGTDDVECKKSFEKLRGYPAALDLIEKLSKALEGMQAGYEVLLASAREGCDLTDDGVANLINMSVSSADEALAAVKEFEKCNS